MGVNKEKQAYLENKLGNLTIELEKIKIALLQPEKLDNVNIEGDTTVKDVGACGVLCATGVF